MTGQQRQTALLAVGCALAALLTVPLGLEGQPQPAATLRVGSWNLDHLGDKGARRGPGENVEQTPADLARYIRHSGVDLLAVQEVSANGPAPRGFPARFRTNSILTKALTELNRTPGNDWTHVLFPKARASDTSQWTGIAWKAARVKPVGSPFLVPVAHGRSSKGAPMWDRNVHALQFSAGSGKTDFLALVVHLKANTTGNFAEHRYQEVKDLVAKLPQVAKAFPGEKDLVIVGDTNILRASEPAVAELERAGFRDLNKADLDTHTAKETQPFDRVFVPKGQPEFARSTLRVLDDFQKKERLSFYDYRKRFSDHYLVVTEVSVLKDDD
ncbi:MAG: endonuclease/exonuclease/phosphatase family protein [Gemmataceae bacterium]|nr:endonuclease/exonuclease/phosphatase family protein [Gemmataceae bacterium]